MRKNLWVWLLLALLFIVLPSNVSAQTVNLGHKTEVSTFKDWKITFNEEYIYRM